LKFFDFESGKVLRLAEAGREITIKLSSSNSKRTPFYYFLVFDCKYGAPD